MEHTTIPAHERTIALPDGRFVPVLSVAGLAHWLEGQPGETKYRYSNSRDCLLCRYLRSHGVPVEAMLPYGWEGAGGTFNGLPRNMDDAACSGDPIDTYAAALSRCHALMARGVE